MSELTIDAGHSEVSITHEEQAIKVIKSSLKWVAGAAVIPLPVLDIAAIAAVQVQMISKISSIYGVNDKNADLKALISASVGTLVPNTLSTSVAGSAIKLLPGYGTIIGSASMAAFATASTYAVGKVFISHFEKGGRIEDFNVEEASVDLKSEFTSAQKTTSKSTNTASK